MPGKGSYTWDAEAVSPPLSLNRLGYLRAGLRGVAIVGLILAGLACLLPLRLVERAVVGPRRPLTPHVIRVVCRAVVRVMGLRYRIEGRPMRHPGAFVANHASWLDIFVLNAAMPVCFVAKSEVAGWPGIGLLARVTGTVFIARDRRETTAQLAGIRTRLAARDSLLFFPEGTSTDGRRVLPFRPTLFAAFLGDPLQDSLWVQPVTVAYAAPPGADPRAYGWWGGMDLAPHLLSTLATAPQGGVTVSFHPAVRVRDFADRKALAAATEATVRKGLEDAGIRPPEARP